MQNEVFSFSPAEGKPAPILISSPHSGTDFPSEVAEQINPSAVNFPADADWFVDQLYDFAPDMGISLITANYSRYVIDLNRSSKNEKLYSDNRVQFDLVPTQQFDLTSLYEINPESEEIERRIENYYKPYYKKIEETLLRLRKDFSHVLFFDAHSIKHQVPAVQKDIFPDLVLGNRDETTSDERLIKSAVSILNDNQWEFSHNFPFKGGNLTRHFGRPDEGVHALQLEMSQRIYMDEEKNVLLSKESNLVKGHLQKLFKNLIKTLGEMNA